MADRSISEQAVEITWQEPAAWLGTSRREDGETDIPPTVRVFLGNVDRDLKARRTVVGTAG
jgi:hypothetical protein